LNSLSWHGRPARDHHAQDARATPDSGNFSPDAKNIAPGTLRLRSERSGSGDGRVYLIVITATDASNNVSHVCLTVVVPRAKASQTTTRLTPKPLLPLLIATHTTALRRLDISSWAMGRL
jgi:hypothetical protein